MEFTLIDKYLIHINVALNILKFTKDYTIQEFEHKEHEAYLNGLTDSMRLVLRVKV